MGLFLITVLLLRLINFKNNTHNIPVKVVRMLCKRIVFTNDDGIYCDELVSHMSRMDITHKLYKEDTYTEIIIKADDERLYELCCELTGGVKKTEIRNYILKLLLREYGCFNADERKVICASVLRCDFLDELSGRMYIYLKVNKSINPIAFYRFMCRDMEENIKELVYDEADKMLSVNDNGDFIEILRYFSRISPDSADTVELTADSSGVRISACFPKQSEAIMEEYGEEDADVLSELVTLNPKHISVYGREEFLNSDLAGVITAVFEERIEYKG